MTVADTPTRNVFAGPLTSAVLTIGGVTLDNLYVLRNGAVTTDYTLAGATLTPFTPLVGGETLYVERREPYAQPFDDVENRALYAATVQGTLDSLTLQVQQIADMVRRNVAGEKPLDDASGIVVDAPQASLVAVGAEGGWLAGAAISSLLGGAPVLLGVANGGTGGNTQAAARTSLGIGTGALVNTGAAPGDVVLLDPSGYVAAGFLPEVSSGLGGILPARPAATGRQFVANPTVGDAGWREPLWRRVGLLEVTSASTTSLDLRAATTEWDIYPAFEVELIFNVSAVNVPTLRFDIDGSVISSGTYGYTGLVSNSGGQAPWQNAGTANSVPLADSTSRFGAVANLKDVTLIRGRIQNPEAVDGATVLSASGYFEAHTIQYDSSIINLFATFSARNSTVGYWRGLQIAIGAGNLWNVRCRVWGLLPDTF